ncbi:hypothetical protein QAD02_016358 [Eretmocerus hayati]|uniref:Uncharacterized protein n=1 Tax=Eretmocerus hayati TaxID=131215 RepID=A0ACC2PAU3_9HYME|nr:hypothetical protein QAD02_016358 [Eretmocerus hayati]
MVFNHSVQQNCRYQPQTHLDPKRERNVSALPSAYINFFHCEERSIVRDTEVKGVGRYASDNPINPLEIASEDIPVRVISQEITPTIQTLGRMAIIFCFTIYSSQWTQRNVKQPLHRLAGVVTGILCLFGKYQDILGGQLPTAYEEHQYRIYPQPMNGRDIVAESEKRWPKVRDAMGLPDDIAIGEMACLGLCITYILYLVKHVNSMSFRPYETKRLTATFAQLAITLDAKTVKVPSIDVLNGLSMFMSAHHKVRNITIRILRDLAYCPTTRFAPIPRAILRNMWWTELTHLQFIDEYIVQGNMDILALPEVAGEERAALQDAYTYLLSLEEHERPLAEIMYDDVDTAVLQQKNYQMLYAAARAIASIGNPNINNIQVRDNAVLTQFKQKIVWYINTKRSVGVASALEAYCKQLGEFATNELLTALTKSPQLVPETTRARPNLSEIQEK